MMMGEMLEPGIIKSRQYFMDKNFISGYQHFDLSPFWLRTQVSISVLTFQAGCRFHLSPKLEKKKIAPSALR